MSEDDLVREKERARRSTAEQDSRGGAYGFAPGYVPVGLSARGQEDVKDFADRLSYLMENEEERLRISANAMTRVEGYLTEEIVMGMWNDLFSSLTTDSRG